MCKNQEQHAYKVSEIIMSSIIEFVSGLRLEQYTDNHLQRSSQSKFW